MGTCIICYDRMDMQEYGDDRENTELSIKLRCGHSFHTRCIVDCLSQIDRKCPQCMNVKDPPTTEQINAKLRSEIKKTPAIKELLDELEETTKEYQEDILNLKKEVSEYAKRRVLELGLDKKRSHMLTCLRKIQTKAKNVAKSKGLKYVEALTPDTARGYYYSSVFERLFYKQQLCYKLHRLKYPRLYMSFF